MNFLDQEIKYIAGVGEKRAKLLNTELGIYTVEDMLRYYPYRYVDRSKFYHIRDIESDTAYVQIKGRITHFEKIGTGRKQRLTALFSDGERSIELVWFQGVKFIQNKYKVGMEYVLFGKPTYFNRSYNFAHPELEPISDLPKIEKMGLQPFYNTTEKMKKGYLHTKTIQKITHHLIVQLYNHPLSEILPSHILQAYHLMNLTQSFIHIHFPKSTQHLQQARMRFKFEELFFIQLNIVRQVDWRNKHFKGFVFSTVGEIFHHFYQHNLPFDLTNAQKRVIKEIRADLGSGRQMNRLLQGDVGSGKTVVALLSMLIALDNGYQTCLMAPTEILATQHYESITQLLQGTTVQVALLTGSTRQKERTTLFENLQNGTLHILIGTHALLEDNVQFQNLGLAIIDEQHRFGVVQRSKLWKKNRQPPHVLVMTATPIPRTLAMTVYGDLSVSVIDELPPGRKPIATYHYYEQKRNALLGFLVEQIDKGRQLYIVYPLIQESEKMDYQNLEEGYEFFKSYFTNHTISMVHGQMKPDEKEKNMQDFATGKTRILVATTVIEVGVNVPNASVMVIESAERFGLSQLHQLRGRVGRGTAQSYCLLLTGVKLSKEARQRMEIMTRTNDGFEIAEADLKLRGPGDFEGTQQSGLPFQLKIANLTKDIQLMTIARDAAQNIIKQDPQLQQAQHQAIATYLQKLKKNSIDWSVIS